jgi:hypothetical protein
MRQTITTNQRQSIDRLLDRSNAKGVPLDTALDQIRRRYGDTVADLVTEEYYGPPRQDGV